MPRTRVKICGVCRFEDALTAARLGADAIGLVFHPPSPRNVTEELAGEILAALPSFVTPVALFVDADPQRAQAIVKRLGFAYVQFHGHESPEVMCAMAEATGANLLKAIRIDATVSEQLDHCRDASARLPAGRLRGLVLETAGSAPGGTGQANDWAAVRSLQAAGACDGLPPLIAAGGLTPQNVAEVIRSIRPWAVDVSSGVEAERGKKSEQKIRAFIEAVRDADRA